VGFLAGVFQVVDVNVQVHGEPPWTLRRFVEANDRRGHGPAAADCACSGTSESLPNVEEGICTKGDR